VRAKDRELQTYREKGVRVIFCNEKEGRERTEISSSSSKPSTRKFRLFLDAFAVTSRRRPSSSILSLSLLLTSSLFSFFFPLFAALLSLRHNTQKTTKTDSFL